MSGGVESLRFVDGKLCEKAAVGLVDLAWTQQTCKEALALSRFEPPDVSSSNVFCRRTILCPACIPSRLKGTTKTLTPVPAEFEMTAWI